MITTLLLSAIGVLFIGIIISLHTFDDYEFDEDEFKARLAEMFKDQPEMLDHLDDPIVEPKDYVGIPSRLSKILDGADCSRYKRLTESWLSDWKVISTCAKKSLYHLSFSEVAAMYGKSEEELIRFLNARCPNTLYRREYNRFLEQEIRKNISHALPPEGGRLSGDERP